ncbi:MAG: DNA repair protein RadA [Bacteroidetes bacterium]|nr:DNA repair protein RadA [Bacteroidota bacterium]MBU1113757.1 DNA repair protein RadA [Bacteroidota bacterium]MBU1800131.1 DNA repair protein RadA [Bacteroidota bacterium]
MSKLKVKYVCSSCGYETLKWLGKCPECNEWNTFSEELVDNKNSSPVLTTILNIVKLDEIVETEEKRIETNISEFDRVLGGGFMQGSVVLIGGDPGIGKSTLVMQAASSIKGKVLYVSGEESTTQLNQRAKRLKLHTSNLYVLAVTEIELIEAAVNKINPDVVIIDSIQTMQRAELDNAPGTVTQIRESANKIMQLAKGKNFVAVLVGHITKEGYIAGPKLLEHMVDAVLQFEGDRNHNYRILRSLKNRFGGTNEIGIFEMHDDGLTEVKNPSEIFLSEHSADSTGSVITATIEGSRPVLLEIQALVTPSNYGNPQRVATGFDYKRLSILLAVLEKRVKLRLSSANVFINIAGGLKIYEPAADLAVCCSIVSSFKDKSCKEGFVAIGEVGLGGEIRSVSQIEKRIQEAEKLGFTSIIIPKTNYKSVKGKYSINVLPVKNVFDALVEIMG